MDVASLQGLWRRSLIARADGERDTTTAVYWLQGPAEYIDLRQPTGAPDFSHVRGLDDLTYDDCAWLARQEGFAGRLTRDGRWFEWLRTIDFQPPTGRADAGSLAWDGDTLIETGRDVAYVEHWHRDPSRPIRPASCNSAASTRTMLLRVGEDFMYARERAVKLDEGYPTLAEYVAAAPDLATARLLLDCEISFGAVERAGLRIQASTLPFRVGAFLEE